MAKYRKQRRKATVFSDEGRMERRQLLKEGMMQLCLKAGIRELADMMRAEAMEIAGPKSKKLPGRKAHHWGRETGSVVLGGRKVRISRPRVRGIDGGEIALKSYEASRNEDLLEEHVLEGMLCGLASRTFGRFEFERTDCPAQYGASRSSVSRRLVQGTEKRLAQRLAKPLDNLRLAALLYPSGEPTHQIVSGGP